MIKMQMDALLARAARHRASDVHITAERPPLMRVDGDLVPIGGHESPLPESWVEAAALSFMSPLQHQEFAERQEVDLALATPGIGR